MKIVLLLNSVVDYFAHILYLPNTHQLHGPWLGVLHARMNGYSALLHDIAPGKYIVIKVEYGLQLHFKIFLNKTDRNKITIKMILDFKILSLWFVIEYWWYNTLTRKNDLFLNVFVKSHCATPSLICSASCFVVEVCLSNYNLNSFLIHQPPFSKGYHWYLMHREFLGII